MVQSGVLRVNNFFKGLLILNFFLLFNYSCDSDPKPRGDQKTHQIERSKTSIHRPAFNADSAYHFIQQQVDFGPRVPNTEAHAKAAEYLSHKLGSFGFNIIEQKTEVTAFDNTKLSIINIIGEYKSELNNRILLFAHWDTRPFADQDTENKTKPIDGANDGASGIGVLLEIARQINILQPNIGVDIIFFDGEDYGQPSSDMRPDKGDTWCLGSQHWSKNMHRRNYRPNYGILLDMVGAKDAIFTKEAISMHFAPHVVDKVWNIASELNHGRVFVQQKTQHVGMDDHYYVNTIANIPSIDIIQYDPSTGAFAPHWHTHNDNMDVISKGTLKAVGETVLATVLSEVISQ